MRAPKFWARRSVMGCMLSPLGWLYGLGGIMRQAFASPAKCGVPVICVGNLTAGGSGKTPTVLAMADYFQNQGKTVHILCYGYGGREQGPLQVDLHKHSFADVGDEAILLAEKAPTWIGRDRATSAQKAVAAGAEIIIMDDGFQYPYLHKDKHIMVIDGGFGFGNRHLIPAGPLREFKSRGLARADQFLIVGPDETGITQGLPADKTLTATLAPQPMEELHGKKITAFAAIGRPEKFFDTLRNLGAYIGTTYAFPDHHAFNKEELTHILRQAEKDQVPVYTTSKDAVRLPAPVRNQVKVLPVELDIQEIKNLAAV